MIARSFSNPLEGNPHIPLMLGGLLVSGGVALMVVLVAVCCLGQADKSNTTNTEGAPKSKKFRKQGQCKDPTSLVAMEAAKTDTIKSVDVDSNPAYNTTVNNYQDLYEEMPDQHQEQAKTDEELYVSMDLEKEESNFEYLSPQEFEKALPSSPSKESHGGSTAKLLEESSQPKEKDEEDVSDEDEDGYVTYNPEKPMFLPSSLTIPHPLPRDVEGQIYENTTSSSPSSQRKKKHSYVNDVEKLVREIEADTERENEEDRSSYCNVQEWQGTANETTLSKEQQELDELDSGLYVNNLDALVEAAKKFEEKEKRKTQEDAADQRTPYMNDLFATLQKTQEEKMSTTEDVTSESVYENSGNYFLSSSYKH